MISLFAEDGTRKTKVRMGTAGYMAPEVVRGEPATEKSDIYSLGVIFFRMLTGIWYEPRCNSFSSYALFDSCTASIELRRLDFDYAGYVTKFIEKGISLPTWLDRKKMLGGQIGKSPKP